MLGFQKGHNKALNELLVRLKQNMANNYKDNAQENYRDFCVLLTRLQEEGKIKGRQNDYYEAQKQEYAQLLKNFTHKDQKPYWT